MCNKILRRVATNTVLMLVSHYEKITLSLSSLSILYGDLFFSNFVIK